MDDSANLLVFGAARGGQDVEKIKAVHIEDMITTRYRLDDPDVVRIGIERGNVGWRCHRVRLQRGLPRLPTAEVEAILVDANKILADLLQEYEIDDDQRARVQKQKRFAEEYDKRAADVRAAEESRRAAVSTRTSRLRAQRLAKEAECEAGARPKPGQRN